MPLRFVALFAATTALRARLCPARVRRRAAADRPHLADPAEAAHAVAVPASRLAADRATNRRVRAVAVRIADDQARLDVALRAVADRLAVTLPAEPTDQERGWADEIAADSGDEFDRAYVNRLRAEYGTLFGLASDVRAGTRDDDVRAFAQTAVDTSLGHLTLLESTGLAETTSLLVSATEDDTLGGGDLAARCRSRGPRRRRHVRPAPPARNPRQALAAHPEVSRPMSLSAALIPVSPHDTGIAEAAALSGRLTYLCMCLTLCWGVLAATGWVRRFSGQDALRTGHVLLAAFTLATGTLHGLTFLFLEDDPFGVADLLLPFYDGTPRHALGIAGLELVIAVSVTAGLRRGAGEGRWLRFHQFGYLAIGLLAVHAWLGAISSGHLSSSGSPASRCSCRRWCCRPAGAARVGPRPRRADRHRAPRSPEPGHRARRRRQPPLPLLRRLPVRGAPGLPARPRRAAGVRETAGCPAKRPARPGGRARLSHESHPPVGSHPMSERIVIAGAGLAGLRAAERLRELGFDGEVVVLGAEPDIAYHRPALSKQLLTGAVSRADTLLADPLEVDAEWRFDTPVTALSPNRQVVHLARRGTPLRRPDHRHRRRTAPDARRAARPPARRRRPHPRRHDRPPARPRHQPRPGRRHRRRLHRLRSRLQPARDEPRRRPHRPGAGPCWPTSSAPTSASGSRRCTPPAASGLELGTTIRRWRPAPTSRRPRVRRRPRPRRRLRRRRRRQRPGGVLAARRQAAARRRRRLRAHLPRRRLGDDRRGRRRRPLAQPPLRPGAPARRTLAQRRRDEPRRGREPPRRPPGLAGRTRRCRATGPNSTASASRSPAGPCSATDTVLLESPVPGTRPITGFVRHGPAGRAHRPRQPRRGAALDGRAGPPAPATRPSRRRPKVRPRHHSRRAVAGLT